MGKLGKALILVALILALSLSLFSCRTGAYWQRQGSDTQEIDVNTQEVNGSAKYIVYAALNSAGNMIPSTGEGSSAAIAAYAVVGYTGLVAELVIPSTYTGTNLDATPHNVTKVIACESDGAGYAAYKLSMDGGAYTRNYAPLANNTVVTSIVFGSNVTSVGAGVCAGMVNLKSVTFTSTVALGGYAFAACAQLETVTGNYTVSDASKPPFFSSGYTPD